MIENLLVFVHFFTASIIFSIFRKRSTSYWTSKTVVWLNIEVSVAKVIYGGSIKTFLNCKTVPVKFGVKIVNFFGLNFVENNQILFQIS